MRGHRKRQSRPLAPEQAIEKAKTTALRLLRYRLRSERELLIRLQAKGWDESVAQKVVARFKEVGLVDDRQFAEAVVQSALNDTQPHSRFEVRYKLRSLGVPDEVIEEALSVWTEEVEREMARRYLQRRLRTTPSPTPKDLQRALCAARQKGFEFDALRDALRAFGDLSETDAQDR